MLTVHPIKAFSDNYIWCIENPATRQCVVVDPGDAKPVVKYMQDNHLTLHSILVTHHHYDHTDGIDPLLKEAAKTATSAIDVYGPANSKISQINNPLTQGDEISIFNTQFRVSEVPGHTLDHISFFSPSDPQHKSPWLFCGDTLFSSGCGRLFEGSPKQMLTSLKALAKHPTDTKVYCTHEYTLANLAFSEAVAPHNQKIKDYAQSCQKKRENGLPTLPTSIQTELEINPFLRCDKVEIKESVSRHSNLEMLSELEVFTALRSWKDSF